MSRRFRNLCCMSVIGVVAFVLCFSSVKPLPAQIPPPKQLSQAEWEQVHTMTVAAMNDLYNLHFAESEKKCLQVIALAPQDPRGYFFRAMIYYYRGNQSDDNTDHSKFIKLSSQGIKVCENILEKNPRDSKAMFYMGGLQGYRGLVHFSNGETSKAVWEGKKGYDKLKESVELDPNNVDAQMGLGLFTYMIAQAPAFIRPVLKVAGLNGDRIQGLRYLENVAAKGIYAKYEAMNWLSNFYCNADEEQYERAGYHFNNLVNQFPDNYFYRKRYGDILIDDLHNPDKALLQFQSILNNGLNFKGISNNPGIICNALLQMSNANLLKMNFTEAIEWLQKCISLNSHPGYVSLSHSLIGKYLEIQGNRTQAQAYYQQSPKERISIERLKKPLSGDDILLFKQQCLLEGGDFDKSITFGEQLLANTNASQDIRAQALYYLGRAYKEKGNFKKAEEYFAEGSTIVVTEENWIPAKSRYYCGLVQLKQGKKTDAQRNFEQALSYQKYEDEDQTKRRIQKELNRLKS
jgi:tetratricopeptide (TPR) repeat protein